MRPTTPGPTPTAPPTTPCGSSRRATSSPTGPPAPKNKRLEESIAIEEVRKIEEGPGRARRCDEFEAEERRETRPRKLLAGHLREIVGNPFKPPRFEPALADQHRRATSPGHLRGPGLRPHADPGRRPPGRRLRRGAVLRHCAGTELHVKDQPVSTSAAAG